MHSCVHMCFSPYNSTFTKRPVTGARAGAWGRARAALAGRGPAAAAVRARAGGGLAVVGRRGARHARRPLRQDPPPVRVPYPTLLRNIHLPTALDTPGDLFVKIRHRCAYPTLPCLETYIC